MGNKSEGKMLQESLTHTWKNVWEVLEDHEIEEVFELNEDYKDFLDAGKTERESAREIVRAAKDNGYISIEKLMEESIKPVPGTKVYGLNKDKAVVLFVIGEDSLEDGMNIIGSHLDSPRLDLKQFPLYEDSELAMLKTHYYGGIKKYQ